MATNSKQDRLIGCGIADVAARFLANELIETGITATGTTLATGYAIKSDYVHFGTVASSTGATLPDWPVGTVIEVDNGGVNTLNVFPPSASQQIDTGTSAGSGGAAQTIATAKSGRFRRTSATVWRYVLLN